MKKKRKSAKLAKRQQQGTSEETLKRLPHSIIVAKPGIGRLLTQLMMDIRHCFEPFTASKIQFKQTNSLKDFFSIAPVLHVSHLIVFSRTDLSVRLRLMRLPRGPTLTFRVQSYTLAKDVVAAFKRSSTDGSIFEKRPLLVMNGFARSDGIDQQQQQEGNSAEHHVQLMEEMFQNMIPSFDIRRLKPESIKRALLINYNRDSGLLDLRQYRIVLSPVEANRSVKKLMHKRVPDLSHLKDISQLMSADAGLSESEAELDNEDNVVPMPASLDSNGVTEKRRSRSKKAAAAAKSMATPLSGCRCAVRLYEIGPRLSLQLVKIEAGLNTGQVLFHQFVEKTQSEMDELRRKRKQLKKAKYLAKNQDAWSNNNAAKNSSTERRKRPYPSEDLTQRRRDKTGRNSLKKTKRVRFSDD